MVIGQPCPRPANNVYVKCAPHLPKNLDTTILAVLRYNTLERTLQYSDIVKNGVLRICGYYRTNRPLQPNLLAGNDYDFDVGAIVRPWMQGSRKIRKRHGKESSCFDGLLLRPGVSTTSSAYPLHSTESGTGGSISPAGIRRWDL
jgi:hypothetical protein